MRIEFTPNTEGKPPDFGPLLFDKVADAAIVFEEGPLEGHALTGFVIQRLRSGDFEVLPPDRPVLHGDKRGASYAILRRLNVSDEIWRPRITPALKQYVLSAFVIWWTGQATEARTSPDR